MNRTRLLAAVLVVVLLAGNLDSTFVPLAAAAGSTDGQTLVIDREVADGAEPASHAGSPDAHPPQRDLSAGAVRSHAVTEAGLLYDSYEYDTSEWLRLAGYSSIDTADPLENSSRRRIYEAIARSPGTYPVELAESTSLSRSTVRYHVRVLEKAGLITSEKIQGRRRYFPRETDDGELQVALKDDVSRSVLTTMYREGPATVSHLASELDRAPSTTSYHLSRLVELDLVEQSREDGAVVNRLAAETERELDRRAASGAAAAPPDDALRLTRVPAAERSAVRRAAQRDVDATGEKANGSRSGPTSVTAAAAGTS